MKFRYFPSQKTHLPFSYFGTSKLFERSSSASKSPSCFHGGIVHFMSKVSCIIRSSGSLRKEASLFKWAFRTSVKGRTLTSKSFCLHSGRFRVQSCRFPFLQGASFIMWEPLNSWKDESLSLKSLHFHTETAIFLPKVPFFHCGRALYSTQASVSQWISQNSSKDSSAPLKHQSHPPKFSFFIHFGGFCTGNTRPTFRSPSVIHKAQAALIDYLHCTLGLEFPDADHMSKNSPIFLDKVLKKVEKGEEGIGKALSRFLLYHPPNEFEMFFESIGLKPSEFSPFLPRYLMYLKDDHKLLDNYHVLCNYGVARDRIGRIYKEATEVFRYRHGVLALKLQAYEELGLSKTSVGKVVASSPTLLIGDVNRGFLKVLEELEDLGIPRDWIGGTLSNKTLYNWDKLPVFLHFCLELGLSREELGTLIRNHPDFLMDGSGKTVVSLVVLLLKVGANKKEISSLFTEFPCIQVGRFTKNLRGSLRFLAEIEMEPQSIQKLICSRLEFFGYYTLKRPNSISAELSVGRKTLFKIIEEDPDQLKKYVRGFKLSRLPKTSLMQKREFLLRLGFVKESEEMKKVLNQLRGKGNELQERIDFLVKCGFDLKDVSNMVRLAPQVLNQKVGVLEKKINFLVNDSGFRLSSIVSFPRCLTCSIERVKLRFLMYNWLKERGNTPSLAMSTILACSDTNFRKRFIGSHPQGLEMWENFKRTISSS